MLARDRGLLGRAHVLNHLSAARTAAFIRARLTDIVSMRQGAEEAPDLAPVASPPANGTLSPRPATAAPGTPLDSPPVEVERLAELLELAERDALIAGQMIAGGIPVSTPSRFGWPGRLLRTAVLRILRPYATFAASADQQHVQSTMRVLEVLRRLEGEVARLRDEGNARTRVSGQTPSPNRR